MAFGALASGLIGATQAAGEDAGQRMKLANEEASRKRILYMTEEANMDFKKRLDEYTFQKEGERLPETLRREGLINQVKRDPLEERAKKLRLDEMEQTVKDKKEVNALLKTRAGVASRFTGEGRTTALADIDAKLAALGHSVKDQFMAEVEEKTVDPDTESSRTVKYKRPLSEVTSGGSKIESAKAPTAALDYLKKHPEQKAAFKAKYGYLPEGM